jgi:hypothetical protein
MTGRAIVAVVLLLLWSCAADARPRWQMSQSAYIVSGLAAGIAAQHYYGCGQWSRCYARALSRERMSGMVTRFSGSYWTTRR